MYLKFGRRPVMIGTLCVFVASLAGCSAAQTYPQLMALRVLQSFGSGVCEALPVQLVNEIVPFRYPPKHSNELLVLLARTRQSTWLLYCCLMSRFNWSLIRRIHAQRWLLLAPILLCLYRVRWSSSHRGIHFRRGIYICANSGG
jgi:MFS family permease